MRQVTDDSKEDVPDVVHVHTVTEGLPGSYKVILGVNKQPIEMELDTGAIVSLISEATWRELHKPVYTGILSLCFENVSRQQT